MTEKRRLNILYTNIGRGHPFYLDGIVKALRQDYNDEIDLNIIDVFSLSNGISLSLWKLIRAVYHRGSQGGPFGKIYAQLRKSSRPDRYGLTARILARNIRAYLKEHVDPTLVAHPVLVPMISDLVPVYYQHGEIAVPGVAAISGARIIYLPIEHSNKKYNETAKTQARTFISGLCIENSLASKAKDLFTARIKRLEENSHVIGAFFSSGAEPSAHVKKIIAALDSIHREDFKGIVFCRAGGRLEHGLLNLDYVKRFDPFDINENFLEAIKKTSVVAVIYTDRKKESDCTAALFKYFDYFVAPSHERTNWAVGLGLPMFILHPTIGPFSPLNREYLIECLVARDLKTDEDAVNFGSILRQSIKDRSLLYMAQNGFGKHQLNGFSTIAAHLLGNLPGNRQ